MITGECNGDTSDAMICTVPRIYRVPYTFQFLKFSGTPKPSLDAQPWLQDVLGYELETSAPQKNRSPAPNLKRTTDDKNGTLGWFSSPNLLGPFVSYSPDFIRSPFRMVFITRFVYCCLLPADLLGPPPVLGISRSLLPVMLEPMEISWIYHGVHMEIPWVSNGYPMDIMITS